MTSSVELPGPLNVLLVSFTDRPPLVPSRPASPEDSQVVPPEISESSILSVETLTSIDGGQTVFITVTRDSAPSGTVQSSDSQTSTRESSRSSDSFAGKIAGGVVGGLCILLMVALLSVYLVRRRKQEEREEATLPPPYADPDPDMSAQLRSSESHSRAVNKLPRIIELLTGATTDGKTRIDPDPDTVPQLDGTMVRPVTELGEGPLGNIPELPATDRNPFQPSVKSGPVGRTQSKRAGGGDSDNHVMSWAQLDPVASSSRPSQPHSAPDATVSVWGNMNSTLGKL